MHIGVPRETKEDELRVGMTPDGVRALVAAGHAVCVERGAGEASGFADDAYARAGARLVGAEEAWRAPELVVKVKEPTPAEVVHLRPGQILFTYLHLAAAPELTRALREADVIALGYETIRSADGSHPVLAPMSEVAGRLAAQVGVNLLQRPQGGKGMLAGGVAGVARARVAVIGAGIVGSHATAVALALGAEVSVLDVDRGRLARLLERFPSGLETLPASRADLERVVARSDLLIGAVYVGGARAPTVVSEAMVRTMEPGSVIVDVAVDQGGCVETIRPTTHRDPTYRVHGVVHYGVANIPGAVPRTATLALTHATLPHVEAIAALGLEEALRRDPALREGVNLWRGDVVCAGVAESLELRLRPLEELLGGSRGS